MKGISAVEIMMGHLGIATGFSFLYPNRKAGILFVGIFFMLSGYGIMYNYLHKSGYMKHFLKRRLVAVFMPAYIVYLLYGVTEFLLNGSGCFPDGYAIIRYILFGQFFQRMNWYVFEILLFYLLFWLFYQFLPIRTANIILSVFVIMMIGVCFYFHVDNPWYGSSLCFPLGIYYAQRERRWDLKLLDNYWMKNIFLLFLCGFCVMLFFLLGNSSVIGNPAARNIAAVSFCLWVLSLLQKARLENRICRWLGKMSYEIYLLHPFWIFVIGEYIDEPWAYMMTVMTVTLISSALLHIAYASCKFGL